MEKYNTLKNKRDYESFIIEIPNEIKNLCQLIGKSQLNFSEEEVKEVSNLFIDFNKDELFDNKLKRILVVYVGEFFKQHFGGNWVFTGLKSDSWAINEPVITNYEGEGMRMSPSEWIWGMFEKNDENHFIENITYMNDFQKKIDSVFCELFPKRKKK
ncbi:hypothetical protein [Pedobacter sp. R20-19]|uniref:hypothetical protein n=1 Tax=Pedobacter sp. R20-19 TaxID=1270196 RepID=UPI000493B150|nr:hypothetical protein [Pedobacter sp. R20-19]NTE03447.1 hypothetical protein [Agrobacterium tumefaciens]NTE18455.1 hypothetical protein [Agrobacterium tumefaciens]